MFMFIIITRGRLLKRVGESARERADINSGQSRGCRAWLSGCLWRIDKETRNRVRRCAPLSGAVGTVTRACPPAACLPAPRGRPARPASVDSPPWPSSTRSRSSPSTVNRRHAIGGRSTSGVDVALTPTSTVVPQRQTMYRLKHRLQQ